MAAIGSTRGAKEGSGGGREEGSEGNGEGGGAGAGDEGRSLRPAERKGRLLVLFRRGVRRKVFGLLGLLGLLGSVFFYSRVQRGEGNQVERSHQ